MAEGEDKVDDFMGKYFSRDLHTEKYACFFKEITNAFLELPL